MRAFVGVTDWNWYKLLANQSNLTEVNFWQPSGHRQFRAILPGELFLFKLHSPRHFIVGGGVFAHSSLLPISLAWEAFGITNGATDVLQMRSRLERYRHQAEDPFADYTLGCILLESPFFLCENDWIPVPDDWSPNIVQGRTYDLSEEPGLSLWLRLSNHISPSLIGSFQPERYGTPTFFSPRLGQGTFRVLVTDAYERRCALTEERTLPALEAVHIKRYSEDGEHRVDNGLLMRRDLHALFDLGYLTVTPELKVEVSRRIREEFENGREYYRLHGKLIRCPENPLFRPSDTYLRWHNERVFRS